MSFKEAKEYYKLIKTHKELKDKLAQKTINIRIPRSQVLPANDVKLQQWARTIFVNGPGDSLKAILSREHP